MDFLSRSHPADAWRRPRINLEFGLVQYGSASGPERGSGVEEKGLASSSNPASQLIAANGVSQRVAVRSS